jgi:hypothetical protein
MPRHSARSARAHGGAPCATCGRGAATTKAARGGVAQRQGKTATCVRDAGGGAEQRERKESTCAGDVGAVTGQERRAEHLCARACSSSHVLVCEGGAEPLKFLSFTRRDSDMQEGGSMRRVLATHAALRPVERGAGGMGTPRPSIETRHGAAARLRAEPDGKAARLRLARSDRGLAPGGAPATYSAAGDLKV